MIARNDILTALDDVIDPCSIAVGKPIGIASLGLVEACTVEDGDVKLVLCTTGPGCMMIGNLLQAADTRVRGVPGVREVEITVDTSVMWTPARIRKTESETAGSGKPC